MNKFTTTLLSSFLNKHGEDTVNTILSGFVCPQNPDIEKFIKNKSIIFNKQKISSTHLVFRNNASNPIFAGYFTLANKCTNVPIDNISKTLKKVILRFGIEDRQGESIQIALPLIAQFGRNFAYNREESITGDELMLMTIDKIRQAQEILGGNLVFLECEDNVKLTKFYENNEFRIYNEILSNEIEQDTGKRKKYVQMIRRLK